MNKLLTAEFTRLFHSLSYWLCMLFSAGLCIFVSWMRWLDVARNPEVYAQLEASYSNADGVIFVGALYLIFAIASLIGLFVGTDYSDGTIRNKLMVGHARTPIYLSKLIVCSAAGLMIHLLYVIMMLILGQLFLNGTTLSVTQLLSFTLTSCIAVLGLTGLLLLISMSVQNKAAGSVLVLLMTMIMFFATLTIFQRLDAPEYYEPYQYADEKSGKIVQVEGSKNSRYLSGAKRKFYEFLDQFLPSSQIYRIAMNREDDLARMNVYGILLLTVTTGAGIVIFRRKNLN